LAAWLLALPSCFPASQACFLALPSCFPASQAYFLVFQAEILARLVFPV